MYARISEGLNGYAKIFIFKAVLICFLSMLLMLGILIGLSDKTCAAEGDFVWLQNEGGSSYNSGNGIAVDSLGNSYVTGVFQGNVTFGTTVLTSAGGNDIFVAKYDNNGSVIWAKDAGGTETYDWAYGISVDSLGNSYVTGYFNGTATFDSVSLTSAGGSDTFIAKYDNNGDVVWAKSAGGTGNDNGKAIAADSSGNSYVTGFFVGSATFGSTTLTSAGGYDTFLAKYDSTGNVLWAKNAGGTSDEWGLGIDVDNSGNSYITGRFGGSATFGTYTLISSGADDVFLAKYDSSGSVVWAESDGGTNNDWGRAISIDSSGNSYITGDFRDIAAFGSTSLSSSGTQDVFVAKYGPTGNILWAKSAGGTDSEEGSAIAVDSSGSIYITGYFGSNDAQNHIHYTSAFGPASLKASGFFDIFFAKYDSTGNPVWAKRAGGPAWDGGKGIAVDSSGNTYLTGSFEGTAQFGTSSVASTGPADVFTGKYIQDAIFCGILCNENFEQGFLHWDKYGKPGSYSIETAGAYEGNKALKSEQLYTAGEDVIWPGISQLADINGGSVYNLRVWLKTTNAVNGELRVKWWNKSGDLLSAEYPVPLIEGTNSSWFSEYVTLTAPATATKVEVTIQHGVTDSNTNAYGSTLWIDNIIFVCNTLCNEGFEDGDKFWETKENFEGEIITADAFEGTQSLKLTQNLLPADTPQWSSVGQRFFVNGGSDYDLSFWMKKENTAQGHVKILWRDSVDQVISQQFPIGGINGTDLTWTQMTVSLTAPANASTAELLINHGVGLTNTNSTGSTLFIDYVQFEDVSCYTIICNPSFEYGLDYWNKNGTPDNTISTDAVDGVNSLRSEHTRTTAQGPAWSGVYQQITSVQPAQTYGIGMWIKSQNAAQGHVKIKWYNGGGTVSQVDYPIININGTLGWTSFSKLVTSPADAATAEIFIWHGINTSSQNVLGSTIWVDNIEFDVATSACGTLCNESFEQGLLYWTVSGAVGSHNIETTGAHEGLKSARSEQLYTSGDEAKWAGITQYAQVKEGTTYRFRFWLKKTNLNSGHVRIIWRNSSGSLLSTEYPLSGISGTAAAWYKREANVTAPATAAKAEISIWHGVNGGVNVPGSTMWIDDITLICQSLCNPGFEDGTIHWEANGKNEAEIITTGSQEGTQAIKITQGLEAGDQAQWAGVSQRTIVTGGNSYNLSFWMKKENAVQGHVKIKWRDANDQVISQQFPIGGINGTNLAWTQMNTTLTAPATAETVEIFIWHGVDGTNQNALGSALYLDNIMFAQIP